MQRKFGDIWAVHTTSAVDHRYSDRFLNGVFQLEDVMECDSKLIPVLREGVDVVKMIFFKKLQIVFSQKYADRGATFVNRLSGAVVNDLFGTPNPDEPFAGFLRENRAVFEEEMNKIGTQFEEMRIPLTDALRIQFLCDSREGLDSSSILVRAKELHVLLVEREVPLPAHFTNLVRTLGHAFGILVPEIQETKAAISPN